jgi:hypothetical protein
MANPNQMFSMCQEKKILPLQSERQLPLLETFVTEKMNGTPSVVNRHRFAVDPDKFFHFDAHPDPDWHQSMRGYLRILLQFLPTLENRAKKFTFVFREKTIYIYFYFIHSNASLQCFLSHKRQRCHVVKYLYFGQHIENFW